MLGSRYSKDLLIKPSGRLALDFCSMPWKFKSLSRIPKSIGICKKIIRESKLTYRKLVRIYAHKFEHVSKLKHMSY